MLLGLPLLAAVTLASQAPDPRSPRHPPDQPPLPTRATRAAQPPVIDGRDDDVVWREALPITGFQEWRPSEGGPPTLGRHSWNPVIGAASRHTASSSRPSMTGG